MTGELGSYTEPSSFFEQYPDFRPISEMSDIVPEKNTGVLWAMNRYIFHPRGFAMSFAWAPDGSVLGWKLLGDGRELYTFHHDDDDDGFAKFEAFLKEHYARD